MSRRPGLSLTEVLVALFIMGIGCIAILTLFPLGALNMAQAFRDDRCTQSAYQADAYLRAYVRTARDTGRLNNASEKFLEAMTDPDPKKAVTSYMPVIGAGPSYPVMIDPLGYLARGGMNDTPTAPASRILWTADGGFGDGTGGSHTTALPRRSLGNITKLIASETVKQRPLSIRTCSLLDGFGFDSAGQPATVGGGTTIDRDLRYNWLWLLQRPKLSEAATTVTVVVFDKRAPNYAPPTGVPLETVWIPTAAATGLTQVSFTGSYAANTLPNVQRGGWLLDASICLINRTPAGSPPTVVPFRGSGNPPPGAEPWVRNANFYRVVSVTETTTGIDVELEIPLRDDTGRNVAPVTNDPPLPLSERRFMYLSGAAEVFERPLPLEL